jgi:cytoskeletal protein CcmA (bactofilin family)
MEGECCMSEHTNDSRAAQPTVFAQNCHIRGDISIDGDAIVLGTIEGNVETSGRIEVGSEGTIEGNVLAGSMQLEGRVAGDVRCDDELDLSGHVDGNVAGGKVCMAATATLIGSLRAKVVSVAEGAVYRGEVIIGPDALDDMTDHKAVNQAKTTKAARPTSDETELSDGEREIETAPARGAVSGLLRRRHDLLSRSGNGSAT